MRSEINEETMAKIRAVMMFVTAQVAKSTLTVDHWKIGSVIELSDATGTQGLVFIKTSNN